MRSLRVTVFSVCCVFSLFFCNEVVAAPITPGSFSTTWDTTNPGTSSTTQITIPGTGTGYNYNIYWESLSSTTATGTITGITSSSRTITFPEPGRYRVDITGNFPRIFFNNAGDKAKILTVEQWGTIAWTNMQYAFFGATNLRVPATDAPDLRGVTTMTGMFRSSGINDPINHWDVSTIVSMDRVFVGATEFNQPLDNWDTASVTNIFSMFNGATSFNQPLNSWDVSNVVFMQQMFLNAAAFNQPLDNWNTSKVTNMTQLFSGATSFNQNINTWNTASTTGMASLFQGATSFNQPLNDWNTARVTSMSQMFLGASKFNQSLEDWQVASVTSMARMFEGVQLSESNSDTTFSAWAGQAVRSAVPLHVGVKSYSATGSAALTALRDNYNWTISEQYLLSYAAPQGVSLMGNTTQIVNLNATGTPVEVDVGKNKRFVGWSDGNSTNPRTDGSVTDNISVVAIVASNGNQSTRVGRVSEVVEKDHQVSTSSDQVVSYVQSIQGLVNTIQYIKSEEKRTQTLFVLAELLEVIQLLLVRSEVE